MLNLLNIKRLSEIVRVLGKYEFTYLLYRLNLTRHLPLHKRFDSRMKPNLNPLLARQILEDLGGAFIKLGQILALRPDLIGQEYSREFEKLLLDCRPVGIDVIKEAVKHLPITNLSYEVLGSGSIAQVHKAKLNDRDVAIKVKKPNVDKIFREDIAIMEYLAKKIKKRFDISYIDVLDVVSEFKKYTQKELNFEFEAKNIQKFATNFQSVNYIKVPEVFAEYSSRDVIVMEYIEGKSILEMPRTDKAIIEKITRACYKMIFEDRFFHADLHPGNIYFNKDKIIFLDFGIVDRIGKELENKLFALFASLIEADLEGTVDALIDLNIGIQDVDEVVLKEGIENILGDYYNVPIKDMNFGQIFYGAVDVAKQSRIKMPANIILFGKSLVTMEGFCKEVSSDFNIVQNAKPYVKKIIAQKSSPKNIANQSKKIAKDFYFEFSKIPHHIKNFSRKFSILEKQTISMENTMENFTDVFKRMAKLISLTFLFAAFFLGGVLLIDFGKLYKGYSIISIICFTISFFIFVKMLGYFYFER